jgi:hypothetical protein
MPDLSRRQLLTGIAAAPLALRASTENTRVAIVRCREYSSTRLAVLKSWCEAKPWR